MIAPRRPGSRLPAPRGIDRWSGTSWAGRVAFADMAALVLAACVAVVLEPRGALPAGAWGLCAVLVAATLGQFALRGAYSRRSSRRSGLDAARDVLTGCAAGTAVALAIAALAVPDRAVSAAVAVAALLGLGLVGLGRAVLMALRHRARVAGRSGQPTLIVGAGWVGLELERRLLACPGLGLRPVGFLDETPGPAFLGTPAAERMLGTPHELGEVARRTNAQHVIVAFSAIRDADVLPAVRAAQGLGLEVSVVPRMFEDVSARQQVEHVSGIALCGLRSTHPRAWPFMVKHAIGRVLAFAMTFAAAPLLVALGLAVKLTSPGPLLFRQLRVGRDGQVFELFKFRTMREAPPVRVEVVRALVASGKAPGGVEEEDRRTRVGILLRRTSLDELPQLLNVLLGHMSLVGPRPERPEFVALYADEIRGYADRHRVKSGMTGWAQVNGLRGQTSMAERIEADNWYVANWSLWLDLKILLLTPLEVLRSRAEAGTGVVEPAERSESALQGAARRG